MGTSRLTVRQKDPRHFPWQKISIQQVSKRRPMVLRRATTCGLTQSDDLWSYAKRRPMVLRKATTYGLTQSDDLRSYAKRRPAVLRRATTAPYAERWSQRQIETAAAIILFFQSCLAVLMRLVFCCECDITSSLGLEYVDITKPPAGDFAFPGAVIVFVN